MDIPATLRQIEALALMEKPIRAALRKCLRKLSLKSSRDLANLSDLGLWLYVYGYAEPALAVCEIANTIEFAGDFVVWTPVETLLLLGARLQRAQGRRAKAAAYAKKVAAPMAAHTEALRRRLSFDWLSDASIARCLRKGDLRAANAWRFSDLGSLFLMSEFGRTLPDLDGNAVDVARVEAKLAEYIDLLKGAR